VSDPAAWSRKYLSYEFADTELLQRALTHKSFAATNNERLEFLGDAVLDLVISETLFGDHNSVDEGGLTRLRALLVRGATLTEMAREIGLDSVLRLGAGEARSGGHQRDSILADALESLFGAIFLDGGFHAVRDVIMRLYASRLDALPGQDDLKDPKTRLQEALQAQGLALPDYEVTREEGPPHARYFDVVCRIPERDLETTGSGRSRRAAEQEAAEQALLLLRDG
jgi:ribonuclease-3